jgi:hypothetical protein
MVSADADETIAPPRADDLAGVVCVVVITWWGVPRDHTAVADPMP